jgi:hypothetical protein
MPKLHSRYLLQKYPMTHIYTPPIFKLVKEQFLKSAGWEIPETIQVDASEVRFAVSSDWGKHDVTCVGIAGEYDLPLSEDGASGKPLRTRMKCYETLRHARHASLLC